MLKLSTTREKFPAESPILIISVIFELTSRPIRFNSVKHLCISLKTDSLEPVTVVITDYSSFTKSLFINSCGMTEDKCSVIVDSFFSRHFND